MVVAMQVNNIRHHSTVDSLKIERIQALQAAWLLHFL